MTSNRDSRNRLKLYGIIAAVIFVLAAVLLVVNVLENKYGYFSDSESEQSAFFEHNGKQYVFNQEFETVLVLGLDSFTNDIDDDAYTNSNQADFLVLLVLDNDAKRYSAIHINRDTMTDVNVLGLAGEKTGTKNQQIALAHTYGNGGMKSCRNTADAVSQLLFGAKIDHFASVTMDAVAIINDSVGGVEVTVSDDFTGIDDTLVKGEKVTLMGEHALNYVRTRYGMDDSTNLKRMERQREYMTSLLNKATAIATEDSNAFADAIVKLDGKVVSDCSAVYLQEIMQRVTDYEFMGIYVPDGKTEVGSKYMEFYVEQDSLAKIICELLCEPIKE